jgi:methylisocitrate lyase
MIFAEALMEPAQFRQFAESIRVPVLANMTEFGRSPLLTLDELRVLGIRLVLYPLTAFRAMSFAATQVYRTLRMTGTQADLLAAMQTREELYEVLDYHAFEAKVNREIS